MKTPEEIKKGLEIAVNGCLDIGGLKKKTIQSWPKRSLTQKRTLKLKSTDGITRWMEVTDLCATTHP